MLIMILVSLLLVGVGILIKHFKWYWLISGYNTMPSQKKKNVDTEGLGNLLGNSMFVIAGILLLGALINSMGYTWGITAAFFIMSIYIICLLVAAQKYDHNEKTMKDRVILIVLIAVLAVILGGSAGLVFSGRGPQQVEINSGNVIIKGLYGITIPVSRIKTVSLEDNMPEVLAKTNGFNAGEVLKGNFRLEELGEAKLFIQSRSGLYVFIITVEGNTVIINHKDDQLTKELYDKLLSVTD
jgi:phosphoglycerol transferase MdoB-like AlkP superfamily enzyme